MPTNLRAVASTLDTYGHSGLYAVVRSDKRAGVSLPVLT